MCHATSSQPIPSSSSLWILYIYIDNLHGLTSFLPFHLVNLNHFKLLRVVGKGAFGKVRIVERKDTGLTFALKYIRKDEGLSHINPSASTWIITESNASVSCE